MLTFIFISPSVVFAQFPTEWGVIEKGVFVIPSEDLPWTDPEGRAAGKRIGYMQVGTVVHVGTCTHVNGPDEESTGDYCNVASEVGVEGKVLASRIFPLTRGKTFVIARKEIVLYDRVKTSQPRDRFSRNSGVIVQLVGDWEGAGRDSVVDVIVTYNLQRPGALTKLAISKTDLVEKAYVIEVPIEENSAPRKFKSQRAKSGELTLEGSTVSLWSIKPASSRTAAVLSEQVFDDIGWDEGTTEEAEELLSKTFDITTSVLNRLRCVTEIQTDVSAGFQFLGSGLKISGTIPVYNNGRLFDFDVDVVERDGVAQYWILTSKTVICAMGEGLVDSEPQAVERVVILGLKRKPYEGSPVRLNIDDVRSSGLSIPHAVDANNVPRLFVVSKFQDYTNVRRLIAQKVSNSGLLDQMTRQERILFQHVMIAKLGDFQRSAPVEDWE